MGKKYPMMGRAWENFWGDDNMLGPGITQVYWICQKLAIVYLRLMCLIVCKFYNKENVWNIEL